MSRQMLNRHAVCACSDSRRFSWIDRPLNRLVIWNERASPRWQMRSDGTPWISRPLSRMVPASVGYRPEIRLNSVVLPAPVSYTHLRAHETRHDLVCRLLLEKKTKKKKKIIK